MVSVIFIFFVIALVAILVISGSFAHTRFQLSAGWWAGIILALLVVGSLHPEFQSLPAYIDSSGCTQESRIDLGAVSEQTVVIDWYVFAFGLVGGIIFLEVFERVLHVPNRVLAFLLLFLAFSSLGSLLYIFFIRKLSYLVFSFVMGTLVGGLLRKAFRSSGNEKNRPQ